MEFTLSPEITKYLVNNASRVLAELKVMKVRAIQKECLRIMCEVIKHCQKGLFNEPCRFGKTNVTARALFICGIKFGVVISGKKGVQSSFKKDSTWLDENGNIQGYDYVLTDNEDIKVFLADIEKAKEIINDKFVLLAITPQLLQHNRNYINILSELMHSTSSCIVFDEAHFYEGSKDTQGMLSDLTSEHSKEDSVDIEEVELKFHGVPMIYLTASPDNESLKTFMKDAIYHETTKEQEWELYQEDLKKPIEDREFDYVPVRNMIFAISDTLPSICINDGIEDWYSLLTKKAAKIDAMKFVNKALTQSLAIINGGFDSKDAVDAENYTPRSATQATMIIKVPSDREKDKKRVADELINIIRSIESNILTLFPQYKEIHIIDATVDGNTVTEKYVNDEIDKHSEAVVIIITKRRLIESTTIRKLDAFLYFSQQGSLSGLKQEMGRPLTPAAGKRFGFIFVFTPELLANVKLSRITVSDSKYKKDTSKSPRHLRDAARKRATRITPLFIIKQDQPMKLLSADQCLLTKSELERTRTKENIFNKDSMFSRYPELKVLLAEYLTEVKGHSTEGNSSSNGSNNKGNTGSKESKSKSTVTSNTPNEKIAMENLVTNIMHVYEQAIQLSKSMDINNLSDMVTECFMQSKDNLGKAFEIMYQDEELYNVLMNIADVLRNDIDAKNPELNVL